MQRLLNYVLRYLNFIMQEKGKYSVDTFFLNLFGMFRCGHFSKKHIKNKKVYVVVDSSTEEEIYRRELPL